MPDQSDSTDVELIELGRELETISAALDHADDHDAAMALLLRMDTVTAAIIATPAQTLRGLFVKARATAWALESDCGLLNPMKEPTANDRLAASIVRDLLKLGPHC
jgi:hypothetical protein